MAAYRQAFNNQPRHFLARNNLGVLYDKLKHYDMAIAEFEQALAIEPGNSLAARNLDNAKKSRAAIKEREIQIPRAETDARAQPNDPRSSYTAARVHAFYGNKETALQWLGKAVRQGYRDLADIKADPAFQSLREEREFELLLLKK
jgi:tetratricopeptide (TPR) repeat protein